MLATVATVAFMVAQVAEAVLGWIPLAIQVLAATEQMALLL
jgi:hypothetical protein